LQRGRNEQWLVATLGGSDRIDAVEDGFGFLHRIIGNEHNIEEVFREVRAFIKGKGVVQYEHPSVTVIILDSYHTLSTT
jgi:hypothetical protein